MGKDRWTEDLIPDQTGRTAVVTGANTGIGLETARALAEKGARVVLACRSEARAEAAADRIRAGDPDGVVEVQVLDLACLESVRAFAEAFRGRHPRLDLLINNAGIMMPPPSKTADGFELQFGVNHLGHFALTGLLLDRILETDASRIVTVASSAERYGKIDFDDLQWERRRYRKMASYGQSKLANLLFTYELQRRLQTAGTRTIATAAHPGWTGTDLQRHASLFRWLNPLVSMEPWQGALPTLFAASAPEADGGGYYGPHGFMELRGYPVMVRSTPASYDENAARRLWEVSEKLTGVSYGLRAGPDLP